jgi:hypothetical protein
MQDRFCNALTVDYGKNAMLDGKPGHIWRRLG